MSEVIAPRGRVILAKAGLDAHERGIHVVAYGLRDAGFEVIYLGLRRTPEQVVTTALDEDADVIGLSSLAGGHRYFSKAILSLLAPIEKPPLVVVGGLVSQPEEEEMIDAGVHTVFNSESSMGSIIERLSQAVVQRRRVLHA